MMTNKLKELNKSIRKINYVWKYLQLKYHKVYKTDRNIKIHEFLPGLLVWHEDLQILCQLCDCLAVVSLGSIDRYLPLPCRTIRLVTLKNNNNTNVNYIFHKDPTNQGIVWFSNQIRVLGKSILKIQDDYTKLNLKFGFKLEFLT